MRRGDRSSGGGGRPLWSAVSFIRNIVMENLTRYPLGLLRALQSNVADLSIGRMAHFLSVEMSHFDPDVERFK